MTCLYNHLHVQTDSLILWNEWIKTKAMLTNIHDHTSVKDDEQRTSGMAYTMAQLERQSLAFPSVNGLTQSVPHDFKCPNDIVMDEYVTSVSLFACPHLALPFATLHV